MLIKPIVIYIFAFHLFKLHIFTFNNENHSKLLIINIY